jgi:three-Cys-motif partner protein
VATPKTVLWDADEHTLAKHELLREYLGAWIPIMSRWNKRLLLIDGFAGPGEYTGGEDGSPIVMLKALLKHKSFIPNGPCTFNFMFVEQDHHRIEHLSGRIAALGKLPANVQVLPPIEGNFSEEMAALLSRMEGKQLIPTFAFIDPFGYKDTAVGLTGQILSFPKCEVLIYVPLYKIARFVDEPSQKNVLTSLYGDDRWKAAAAISGMEARQDCLAALFTEALREHTTHVLDFEMFGRTNSSGYSLFFGTSSDEGLGAIKTAMWKVDPEHGRSFKDPKTRGQTGLFTFGPDLGPLLWLLRGRFRTDPFTIEEADRFVLRETRFRHDGHLRKQTLRPAEDRGELEAWKSDGSRRFAGTYPDGTVLRFRDGATTPAQRD